MNDWQKMTADAICRVCRKQASREQPTIKRCAWRDIGGEYCDDVMCEIDRMPRDNYERIIMASREELAERLEKLEEAADEFCTEEHCPMHHDEFTECQYKIGEEYLCRQAVLNWLAKPLKEANET